MRPLPKFKRHRTHHRGQLRPLRERLSLMDRVRRRERIIRRQVRIEA